jgi:RNA polymerase sigma factor (sigma-70 family)
LAVATRTESRAAALYLTNGDFATRADKEFSAIDSIPSLIAQKELRNPPQIDTKKLREVAPMAKADDDFRDLVRRACAGSEDAARELVDEYGGAVRRAVRRALDARLRSKFDSLDFVQDVWKSVFRAPGRLDRVGTPRQLMKYLLAMARHKVSNENRRRLTCERYDVSREQSLQELGKEDLQRLPSPEPAPLDVALGRERQERLMQSVPRGGRRIVQLRLKGLSCERIANKLRVSDRTVRRFLGKFRRAMRL